VQTCPHFYFKCCAKPVKPSSKGTLGPGAQYSPQYIEYHRDHHQRLLQLHDAVLQGCFICDALFQNIGPLWMKTASYHIKGKCRITRYMSTNRLHLSIDYKLCKASEEDIQAIQEISGDIMEDTRVPAGLVGKTFSLLRHKVLPN
jgi:hypothetical protein